MEPLRSGTRSERRESERGTVVRHAAPEGSFGQAIPAIGLSDCDSLGIAGVTANDFTTIGSRTNLGFGNPTTAAREVTITISSSEGAVLGTRSVTVAAEGFAQVDRIADPIGLARADDLFVRIDGAEGLLAWASIVDNATGDPLFLRPEPLCGFEGFPGSRPRS